MMMYSTGEVAKRLGVTRDSIFSALISGAPDAEEDQRRRNQVVGGMKTMTMIDISQGSAIVKVSQSDVPAITICLGRHPCFRSSDLLPDSKSRTHSRSAFSSWRRADS